MGKRIKKLVITAVVPGMLAFTAAQTNAHAAGASMAPTSMNTTTNTNTTAETTTAPSLYLDFVFPPTTTSPYVKGKTEPGNTIQVIKKTDIIAEETVPESGVFNVKIPPQEKGTILTVRASDNKGNYTEKTVEVLEIDVTAPAAPQVDDINIMSTVVTGTTEPNITVKVNIVNVIYSAQSDATGHFSITIPRQPLNNSIYIYAVDNSYNESEWVVKQVGWTTPIGWYVNDLGEKYYYDPATGKMALGWFKDAGKWYYFESNGAARMNSFRILGGKYYFLNEQGEMLTGWQTIYSKKYYFGTDGAARTGLVSIDGKKYYFTSEGVMKTGWVSTGGKWYYFKTDGTAQLGWLQVGGKWYFFNSDATMKVGWLQTGGKWYYLNTSGAMQTGWLKLGTKWYYFNSGGAMQTGWVTISGKKYYFNSSGGWVK